MKSGEEGSSVLVYAIIDHIGMRVSTFGRMISQYIRCIDIHNTVGKIIGVVDLIKECLKSRIGIIVLKRKDRLVSTFRESSLIAIVHL